MKLSQQSAAMAMDPNCVSKAVEGKLHPKVCSSPALNWDRWSAEVHCSLILFWDSQNLFRKIFLNIPFIIIIYLLVLVTPLVVLLADPICNVSDFMSTFGMRRALQFTR